MASCELLSKVCIFVVWNNRSALGDPGRAVVNCFQKFVSLSFETTTGLLLVSGIRLWIAFKSLYLCSLKQLLTGGELPAMSCELLSKVCIFVVWNNGLASVPYSHMLWIAFKSLYLCSLKQQKHRGRQYVMRCELLSKVCIFVVWNNSSRVLLWY